MIERLFVYGTLGPGRPNEHILGAIGGDWETAWVRGVLHAAGWGAELGFPGIVLDTNGDRIDGFLFSAPRLGEHWGMLDAFEGDAYRRELVPVQRDGKPAVDACIYTLRQVPTGSD